MWREWFIHFCSEDIIKVLNYMEIPWIGNVIRIWFLHLILEHWIQNNKKKTLDILHRCSVMTTTNSFFGENLYRSLKRTSKSKRYFYDILGQRHDFFTMFASIFDMLKVQAFSYIYLVIMNILAKFWNSRFEDLKILKFNDLKFKDLKI